MDFLLIFICIREVITLRETVIRMMIRLGPTSAGA